MQVQALSSNLKVFAVRLARRCSVPGWLAPLFLITIVAALSGCSSAHPSVSTSSRPFDFQRDTFAYPNQLVWDYYYDANGKWTNKRHEPKPDYTHHCFVVSRSSKQFFQNAKFASNQPVADDATYQKLVQRVLSISPRREVAESEKVVIPGYADLRSFSSVHANLLKTECGGAWQSYLQRGHWRMILPFSRHHQEKTASHLFADLQANNPPVVHVVRFPQLTINHSLMLIGAHETQSEILFDTYDPNNPFTPVTLTYDKKSRTFTFPGNDYWPGGRVDIYEIYYNWLY
jgi:hypothetical protein